MADGCLRTYYVYTCEVQCQAAKAAKGNKVNRSRLRQSAGSSHIKFFFGEGPCSRSYGRTAALRLIVQPCDEDEEKDDQFFFVVPSNGAPVEWN